MGANPADLLWDDSLGAGLQQALFDVVGKALGVPVHRLMGFRRARAMPAGLVVLRHAARTTGRPRREEASRPAIPRSN